MTDTTTIPMAMFPRSSKRTRELAQRMLQLTADEPADISECGTAALYVMAAYIALDDKRAEILDNISNTVADLVKANRAEQQRISSGPPTLRQ
jgi:gas vesicle protein